MIEYNDTDDNADLHLASPDETNATLLEGLQWQDSNKTLDRSAHCGNFTSIGGQLGTNATFSIKVS